MRTLTKKYLGGLELPNAAYSVDIAVLDRYQLFSSELVQLSLLGIARYGSLIANVEFKVNISSDQYSLLGSFSKSTIPLMIGAVTLGLSAASALGHRYFSTDCMTHYVSSTLSILKNDNSNKGLSVLLRVLSFQISAQKTIVENSK